MKTINYFSIIFVTALTYLVLAQAEVAQTGTPSGTSPGRETTRSPIPPTQPYPVSQALIDACSGKSQGTTCNYNYPTTQGSQSINGTCVPAGSPTTLACR